MSRTWPSLNVRVGGDAVLAETRASYPRCVICNHDWHGEKCIMKAVDWVSGHISPCQCAMSPGDAA